MSVYYDVREHVVLKNKAAENLCFDVAENIAQIGYRMLLDRAAIWKLELTADGKEYSFKGREVTPELHEITRVIANASEIDMVIDYDGVNFDFTLMEAIEETLNEMPELASDIFDEGITLSGGGAQLFGLAEVISDQLRIRTTLADEPDLCVAHGLSALIDDPDRYENIDLVSGSRSDMLHDD